MLTYAQLEQYYPDRIGKAAPRRMLVEYLQYELLDSLYKEKGSEHLSFIGGTAVRIGYHSGRFSEYLDFDNFGLGFQDFQKLLEQVVKDMKLKGFSIEFRFVEKGAYHCYIKFPELLQREKLTGHANEKILVRIDAQRKERPTDDSRPLVFTMNKFEIYREILINPADIILAQKLLAIAGRKNAKGRDFYDVSFLYGLIEPNWPYIERAFGTTRKEFQKNILKRVTELNFDSLAKDVEPFLFRPKDADRVRLFRRFIGEKLG